MISSDWNSTTESISLSRVLEYTEGHIKQWCQNGGQPNFEVLQKLPCIFLPEGRNDEIARVGQIIETRISGGEVIFDLLIDQDIPPLTNEFIFEHRRLLHMPQEFEFSRNHWAVKEVDLFRFLFKTLKPRRQKPKVFNIPDTEAIEPFLVSAMMPFSEAFNPVYEVIQSAASNAGLACKRADDIWQHPSVMQDVVSLLDRSRIVVCDCTGRNPNVFYEAGIAHTLGREVILITQNEQDIPFDLRHLRYVHYLNNSEGRDSLEALILARMQTIIGH